MSGTSFDAIDAAIVDVEEVGSCLELSPVAASEHAWPPALRERVGEWLDPRTSATPRDLALAHVAVGEALAQAALESIAQAGLAPGQLDLISSHGQTVHHAVGPDGRALATLQLGQPAVIAERTGRTVVADFRPRDIAAGGEGAPLVSFVDALLFADPEHDRAVQNIGGIANVTWIPAARPRDAIAFDTGPGNAVIDALARRLLGQRFDRYGAAAASGAVDERLLEELLAHPYFQAPPPKSTGRETFGDAYADEVVQRARARGLPAADMLATVTELTARSIAAAYRRHLPRWPAEVFLSGGGAENAALVSALARGLARETRRGEATPGLRRVEEMGLPARAKEAIAFAVLGHETVHGRPNTLPGCTGAAHPVTLGAIWPGEGYRELTERLARSAPAITALSLRSTQQRAPAPAGAPPMSAP